MINIGAEAGLTTVITAGYFIWAARGGPLLTGLLPSVPIWKFFDPLRVMDPGASRGIGHSAEWREEED